MSNDEPMPERDSDREPVPPPEIDETLRELVRFAELGMQMGVTLSVGGLLISGSIESAAEYFRATAASLGRANAPAVIKPAIDAVRESYIDSAKELEARAKGTDHLPPNFIHLSRVHIISGGQHVYLDRWRCRLSRVDAFSFGEMSRP